MFQREDLYRSILENHSYLGENWKFYIFYTSQNINCSRLSLSDQLESDFNMANDECLKAQWIQETLFKKFEVLSQEEITLVPKLRQLRDDRLSMEKEVSFRFQKITDFKR